MIKIDWELRLEFEMMKILNQGIDKNVEKGEESIKWFTTLIRMQYRFVSIVLSIILHDLKYLESTCQVYNKIATKLNSLK